MHLSKFLSALFLPVALVLSGAMPSSAKEEKKVVVVTSGDDAKGAYVGIFPEALDADDREALDFKGDGILVEDVVEEGPADKAGIDEGDIILKVGGESVSSVSDFRDRIRNCTPGDKVAVVVWRKGAEKSIDVTLAERPSSMSWHDLDLDFNWQHEETAVPFLGVTSRTIEGDIARDYFSVDKGALVEEVVNDSPAKKAGLKSGDVIVKLGGRATESQEALVQAIRSGKPGEQVKIDYIRKGKKVSAEVELGERKEMRMMGMTSPQERRIALERNGEIIDEEQIREIVREALVKAKVALGDAREDIHKEIERLKEEMRELKKEIEQKKAPDKTKS